MRMRVLLLSLTFCLLSACNSISPTAVITPGSRVYNGTASVGDFMTITINAGAQTIAYSDISNNTSGTVSYIVHADGSYTLNDPSGNLLSAYEVPNYAVLVQAAKTGPNADTPALITAVESSQVSLSTFESQAYNYMQFRTASGGMEVGSVTVGSQGTGAISSYWPFGSYAADNPFHAETLNMASAVLRYRRGGRSAHVLPSRR